MPQKGEIDRSYIDRLQTIGLELEESFKGTKIHHRMKCVACGHKWSATPLSKVQAHKKYGHNGCPNCNLTRQITRKTESRTKNIKQLTDRGLEILSDWTGQRVLDAENTSLPVTVRNKNCGHTFTSNAVNLLSRNVECPVCAEMYRINILNDIQDRKHQQWTKTATAWQIYKSEVTSLSRVNYNKNKAIINPNNLPKGKAGTPGAYHVDHIVSIRFCFEHNIPVEVCADVTNLQMLPWNENVVSKDKLKHIVPKIFEGYVDDLLDKLETPNATK